MNNCELCSSSNHVRHIKGSYVCEDCLEQTLEHYKYDLSEFYVFLSKKYNLNNADDDSEKKNSLRWMNDFHIKLKDNSFWKNQVVNSKYFVINANYISHSIKKQNIDTFCILAEFLGKEEATKLIPLWNEFLKDDHPFVNGAPYVKCSACNKEGPYIGDSFIEKSKSDNIFYCKECYDKAVSEHQHMLIQFLNYSNTFLKSNEVDKVDELIQSYSNKYYCMTSFIKNPAFSPQASVYSNSGSNKNNNFKFLKHITDKIISHGKVQALFNDFIRSTNYGGKPDDFEVEHACKRCHGPELLSEEHGIKDYYQRQNDPNNKCFYCYCWLRLLNDLNSKYGWNPKWAKVISALNDYSITNSHDQANPILFYKYVTAHDIEFTEEMMNYWNFLFEKYDGRHIIKMYSIPDGIIGEASQHISRAIGGFIRNIFR